MFQLYRKSLNQYKMVKKTGVPWKNPQT